MATDPVIPACYYLDEAELSVRVTSAVNGELGGRGRITLDDVCARTEAEWMRCPNFGAKSLRELRAWAAASGRHLGDVPTVPSAVENGLLRAALQRSVVAIDDWLNTYAAEYCAPERVAEAKARVMQYGTIGYIAEVQEQNRRALASRSA